MKGWIKVHREILEHWISDDPDTLLVWLRLMLEANFEEKLKRFNGAMTTVERGQLIFGLNAFSEKTGISISKLRRILKELEADGMISRQKTNKYSIISITNYDIYQDNDSQNAVKTQADSKQNASKEQAGVKQTATPKEVKNDKNGKEDKNNGDKPPRFVFKTAIKKLGVPDAIVDHWMVVRKNKKAANTEHALNLITTEAEKAGITTAQAIEFAANKGWSGFKADWYQNNSQAGFVQTAADKQQGFLDDDFIEGDFSRE